VIGFAAGMIVALAIMSVTHELSLERKAVTVSTFVEDTWLDGYKCGRGELTLEVCHGLLKMRVEEVKKQITEVK